jgi:hypothetical protein
MGWKKRDKKATREDEEEDKDNKRTARDRGVQMRKREAASLPFERFLVRDKALGYGIWEI